MNKFSLIIIGVYILGILITSIHGGLNESSKWAGDNLPNVVIIVAVIEVFSWVELRQKNKQIEKFDNSDFLEI